VTVTEAPEKPTPEAPEKPTPAPNVGQRASAALYAFERSIAVGATVLMVVTYATMVLWSNVNRQYNQFDLLLLKWSGHPEIAAAPKEVVDSISGLWSPILLRILVIGLVYLALRTRAKSFAPEERPPSPRLKDLGISILIAMAISDGLSIIGYLPSIYICLGTLGVLVVGGIQRLVKAGPSVDTVMGLAGTIVGAGAMAWYFLDMGSNAYDWNLGLSGVLLLYLGFIGASMATHDGVHIRVDAIRKSLKGPRFHLYNAISDLLALVFTAFLAYMAFGYLGMLREKEFMQEAARMPQWLAALPIAVAFFTMVLRFGIRIVDSLGAWRRGENPPELAPELH